MHAFDRKQTFVLAAGLVCLQAAAQEMQPRAYVPAPVGLGFAGISYGYSAGGLLFDPGLPIEDARVSSHAATLSLGITLGVLGRTAQVLAVMPYVLADRSGRAAGVERYRYRSGLADMTLRYSMNIHGAPARTRREMAQHRLGRIIGVSLTATAPASQYDPRVVVNIGTNRWAFKPEIGISNTLGRWAVEGAFGVWLYTKNPQYFGNFERTQAPLWSSQAHVVRVFGRRHWAAYDFTYFAGGSAKVNGRPVLSYLSNTRMGGTYGIALSRRQALRFSCFTGVTARVGTDVTSIGIAYQFLWSAGR